MNKIKRIISLQMNKDNIIVEGLIFLIILINVVSAFSLFSISLNMPTEALYINYSVIICGAFIFFLRRFSQPLYMLIFICSIISISPLVLMIFFPLNTIILAVVMNAFVSFFSIAKLMSEKKNPSLSFELLSATIFVHAFSLILSYSFSRFSNLVSLQDVAIMQIQIYTHALVCVCLYISAHQYYKFNNNYGHLAKSPTQPTQIIRKKLLRTVLFFVIFSIVGTPLLLIFPYDLVGKGIANIFRLLMRSIYIFFELLDQIGLLPRTGGPGFINTSDEIAMTGDAPFWAQVLQVIVFTILGAMTLIFFVSLLTEFIRNIFRLFHKVKPSITIKNNDAVVDEVIKIERRKRKSNRKRFFGHGEEKEVRKAFYHQVLLVKKKNIPIEASDSPLEIRNKIKQLHGKDITELTNRYEKVRYDFNLSSYKKKRKP